MVKLKNMLRGQELIERAKSVQKSHQKLFSELKKLPQDDVNELFHTAHEQVFERINCLDCANCCKTTPALILPSDAKRIAKHLKMSLKDFYTRYTVRDEDGDTVFKKTPCVFLDEHNYCTIYFVRPNACREYPHTNHRNMKKILDLTFKNREICPAVFEIAETLKDNL